MAENVYYEAAGNRFAVVRSRGAVASALESPAMDQLALDGVLRRDGSYDYRPWLGFVDRNQARGLGKPVKLQVARVGRQGEFHIDWRDVAKGRHVQGCLTRGGVYAVADWSVRVI